MNLTTFLANKLVDHTLRKTAWTSPTNVYVGLHTASPTKTGNVGELTAAQMPGYARKALTLGAPANGSGASAADLNWDITASATITHATIWDAATGGNPLFQGPLGESKTVANGDILRIPSGSLSVGFD